MSDIKFIDSFCNNQFATFDEAVQSAKRHAYTYKQDVPIYKTHAIARYPFPDIKIDVLEETVQATA